MAANVTVIGDKKLNLKLTAFAGNIKNPKIALKRVGGMLVENYVENFKTEGSTLGDKWKPLSRSTQIAKARYGFGGRGILERTGKLMKSIKILKLSQFLVEIGSNLNYFKYHQSTAPRSKLPRRKMIDITTGLAKKTINILREHLIIPLIK